MSNSLLYLKFGQVSISYVGGRVDKIIPTFITNYMPPYFKALYCKNVHGKSSLITGTKMASIGAKVAILPISILILVLLTFVLNSKPASTKVVLEL